MEKDTKIFDVAIIGGGPAGIMAGIAAGKTGASVIILEKNKYIGIKLLLTGGERCNITNAQFDTKKLAKEYGKEGDFLLRALSNFGPKEVIEFFEKQGLKTKVENQGRVFPESDKARDVLNVLTNCLKSSNVEILYEAEVREIKKSLLAGGNKISGIVLANGKEIFARDYIIATGGMSYSKTGSSGDGYNFAKELGHNIENPRPSLSPIVIKEDWVKKLQGASLKNVAVTAFYNKKKEKVSGDIIFTHFGISGPAILNLGRNIGQFLENGEVKLVLDLNPNLDISMLDKKLQSYFSDNSNKIFKNCLADLLPPKLAPIILEMSLISPTKKAVGITKQERQKLVKLLKELEMTATALLGFDEALITSGGILLKEIDAKTMKSKIIDNLFFAGEVINLHGPTGGYNLQQCWSTGNLAGQGAVKRETIDI